MLRLGVCSPCGSRIGRNTVDPRKPTGNQRASIRRRGEGMPTFAQRAGLCPRLGERKVSRQQRGYSQQQCFDGFHGVEGIPRQ